jgi:pSer/pThr/pTyr-binding forkhead associated (FHA) protein
MESFTSGTFVGAGSFRCVRCDYTLTFNGSEMLRDCPGCGGREFVRASLFSTERITTNVSAIDAEGSEATLVSPPAPDQDVRLAQARAGIEKPGEYILYEENGEQRLVALTREWTRVGRSLAADVRFDDPTVSRRHALIVRQPDGVRLLDDRSLNGVFVNGARVDGRTLKDGDEIIVGRYRLAFMSVPADPNARPTDSETTSLHSIG